MAQECVRLSLYLDRCTRSYGVSPCMATLGGYQPELRFYNSGSDFNNLVSGGVGVEQMNVSLVGGEWSFPDDDTTVAYVRTDEITLAVGEKVLAIVEGVRGADDTFPNVLNFILDDDPTKRHQLSFAPTGLVVWNGDASAAVANTPADAMTTFYSYGLLIQRFATSYAFTGFIEGTGISASEGLVENSTVATGRIVYGGGGGGGSSTYQAADSWDGRLRNARLYRYTAGNAPSVSEIQSLIRTLPVQSASTGATQCFNTYSTCQWRDAYQREDNIYRFCSDGVELEGYAPLISMNDHFRHNSAQIKNDFSIYGRERFYVELDDRLWGDNLQDDPYRDIRPVPTKESLYIQRLLARNRYFNRRRALLEVGTVTNGVFTAISQHHLVIDRVSYTGRRHRVTIELTDGVKLTEDGGALVPKPLTHQLSVGIDENTQQFTITGDTTSDYDVSDTLSLGDEIMVITGLIYAETTNLTTFTVDRGMGGSNTSSHDSDTVVQKCYAVTNQHPVDIVIDLLNNFADLGFATIDMPLFVEQRDQFSATNRATTIITKPKGVDDIIEEIQKSYLFNVWYDSETATMKLKYINSLSELNDDGVVITDDNIVKDSSRYTLEPRRTVSSVLVFYAPRSFSDSGADDDNYKGVEHRNNDRVNNEFARGEDVNITIKSNFIQSQPSARHTADTLLLTGELSGEKLQINLPITFTALKIGDNVPVQYSGRVDELGAVLSKPFRVLENRLVGLRHRALRMQATVFGAAGVSYFRLDISLMDGDDVML